MADNTIEEGKKAEKAAISNEIKSQLPAQPENKDYNVLKSFLALSDAQQYKPGVYGLYDIHLDNKGFNPVMPDRNTSMDMITQHYPGIKGDQAEFIYQKSREAAYNLSINNFRDQSQWYNNKILLDNFKHQGPGYRSPIDQAKILNPALETESFDQTYQTLTEQQGLEAKGVYRDKNGDYDYIANFQGDGTVLAKDDWGANEWVETDNTNFVKQQELRSKFGPSEWETNPALSAFKGFTGGFAGSLVTGLTQGIAAYGNSIANIQKQALGIKEGQDHILNDITGGLDAFGNMGSNFANSVWSPNEDEKEGMFSGDGSAFMYGFSNILGQLTQMWALGGLTGLAAKGVSATNATIGSVSSKVAFGSSGLVMAGFAYEDGKANGIDPEWNALLAASMGIIGAKIESMGANFLVDAAGLQGTRAANKNLLKEFSLKLKGVDFATASDKTKANIVSSFMEKASALTEKAQLANGIKGRVARGLVTSKEEGIEEFLQGASDEVHKNIYNFGRSLSDQYNEKAKQSDINNIDSELKRLSKRFNDDGTTTYLKDGVEIPKTSFDKEYARLQNEKQVKQNINLTTAKKGEGLYNTDWTNVLAQGEGAGGGALGGFVAGMFNKGGRKKSLIHSALNGELNSVEETLEDVYNKEGLAPKNIDSKGVLFDENNVRSKDNPSLNDLAYQQAKNEIFVIKELMKTDLAKLNPGTFKGTKEMRDELVTVLDNRIDINNAIKEKKESLSSISDPAEIQKVQSEIDSLKTSLEILNDKFEYYTNPEYQGKKYDENGTEIGVMDSEPNTTGYTEPVRNLVKENTIRNSFNDLRKLTSPSLVTDLYNAVKEFNVAEAENVKKNKADREAFINLSETEFDTILNDKTKTFNQKIQASRKLVEKMNSIGGVTKKQFTKTISTLTDIQGNLKDFSDEMADNYIRSLTTDELGDYTADELVDSYKTDKKLFSPLLLNEVDANVQKVKTDLEKEYQGINIVDDSVQQIDDFEEVDVKGFFDKYQSKIDELENIPEDEIGDDDRQNQITEAYVSLAKYARAFQVSKAYDKLKENKLDADTLKELSEKLDGDISDIKMKEDPEIKKHKVLTGTERVTTNAKIADMMERLSVLLSQSEASKNSLSLRDINYKTFDIKSKHYIVTDLMSGIANTAENNALKDRLNSKEFNDNIAILDNDKVSIEEKETARVFVYNELKSVEAELFERKLITKEVYKAYFERLLANNTTFVFSDLNEFSVNDYYDLLVNGKIFDNKKGNYYDSSFRMLYAMNYINQIVNLDVVSFDDNLAHIIKSSTSEIPTYEQRQILKDTVATLIGGFNEIHKTAIGIFLKTNTNKFEENAIEKSVTIRGFAGTGKTTVAGKYALNLYAKVTGENFTVHGLVPGFNQVKGITKAIEETVDAADTNTILGGSVVTKKNIDSLLNSVKSGDFLLVDEASLMNEEIIKKIKEKGVKVVFMGDESQGSVKGAVAPVFKHSLRTMPLTQVFRTGVLKLWDLQKSLRSLTAANVSKVSAVTYPSYYYYSDGVNKLGLEYSGSEDLLVKSWIEHATALQNDDAVLVVENDAKRDEILAKYPNMANSVYIIEGNEDHLIQGLSKPYVYSMVSVGNLSGNALRESIKNIYMISSRPERYLNQLVTDPNALNNGSIASNINQIAVVAEKTVDEKIKFIEEQKNMFTTEHDDYSNRYPSKKQAPPTPPQQAPPKPKQGPVYTYAQMRAHQLFKTYNLDRETKQGVQDIIDRLTATIPQTAAIKKRIDYLTAIKPFMPDTVDSVDYKQVVQTIKAALVADGIYVVETDNGFLYAKKEGKNLFVSDDAIKYMALNDFNLKKLLAGNVVSIVPSPVGDVTNDKVTEFAGVKLNDQLISPSGIVSKVVKIVSITNGTGTYHNIHLEDGTVVDEVVLDYYNVYTDKAHKANQDPKENSYGEITFAGEEIPVSSRTIAISPNSNFDLAELIEAHATILNWLFKNNKLVNLKIGKTSDLNVSTVNQNDGTINSKKDDVLVYIDVASIKGLDASIKTLINKHFNGIPFVVAGMYSNDLDGLINFKTATKADASKIVSDGTDVGKARAKYHLFQLYSYLFPNKAFKTGIKVSRNGNIHRDNSITSDSLTDFIKRNQNFYEFKGFLQEPNLTTGQTDLHALFQNRADSTLPPIKVWVKTEKATDVLIKGFINTLPVVKNGDAANNHNAYSTIEATEAFQFIKYNSANFLNNPAVNSFLTNHPKFGLEITKTDPVDYSNKVKILLNEALKDSARYYQNPYKIGFNGKKVKLGDQTNAVLSTQHNTLFNPMLALTDINTIDAIDPKVRADYEAEMARIDAAGSGPSFSGNYGSGFQGYKIKTSDGTEMIYEDVEVITEYVKELLGLTGETALEFRENLISKDGLPLYGMVKSMKIILDKTNGKAIRKVAAHEVVHFVNNYIITENQKEQLYNAVRNLYGNNIDPEEFLALGIESYDKETNTFAAEQEKTLVGSIRSFFEMIRKFFTGIQTSEDLITNHYRDILNGTYRNAELNIQHRTNTDSDEEFTRTKPYSNKSLVYHEFGSDYNFFRMTKLINEIFVDRSNYNTNLDDYRKHNNTIENVFQLIKIGLEGDVKRMIDSGRQIKVLQKDGSVEMVNIADVKNIDIPRVDNSDIKDFLIYKSVQGDNYNYLAQEVLQQFIVTPEGLKTSKKGDSTLGVENSLRDGIGELSKQFKFVMGSIITKSGFVNTEDLIETIRQISTLSRHSKNAEFNENGIMISNRIDLLSTEIQKKINSLNTLGSDRGNKTRDELQAFYDKFLKSHKTFSKGDFKKLSYYDLVYNNEYIFDEIGSDENMALALREKIKIATEMLAIVDQEIISLDKKKKSIMRIFSNFFKIENSRDTNDVKLIREHKQTINTVMYNNAQVKNERLRDLLGLEFTDKGTIVEAKFDRKIIIENNSISVKYKNKTENLMRYSIDNGVVKFTMNSKFLVDGKLTGEAIPYMKFAMDSIGFRIYNSNLVSLNSVDKRVGYDNDLELNTDLIINTVGAMTLSAVNLANQKVVDTYNDNKASMERILVPSETKIDDINIALANTFEVDKSSDVSTSDEDSKTELVGPQDLWKPIEKFSKFQALTTGRKHHTSTRNAKGEKEYLIVRGNWLTRLFQNREDNQDASAPLVTNIRKVMDKVSSSSLDRLNKFNLFFRDGLNNAVRSLFTFGGVKGTVKGTSFQDTTTKDLADSFVAYFVDEFTKSSGGKLKNMNFNVFFELIGDRTYLNYGQMSFASNIFKSDIRTVSKNKKNYISAEVNDSFFEKETELHLQNMKETADESFKNLINFVSSPNSIFGTQAIFSLSAEEKSNPKKFNDLFLPGGAIFPLLQNREVQNNFVRALNKSGLVNGIDFNYDFNKNNEFVFSVGNKVSSFYDVNGNMDLMFNERTERYWNGPGIQKQMAELGMSKLDLFFSEQYEEFAKFLGKNKHEMPERLHYAFGENQMIDEKTGETKARQLLSLDAVSVKYLQDTKKLNEALRKSKRNPDDQQAKQDVDSINPVKPNKQFYTLHPVYKAMYHTFMISNRSINPLFTGANYQDKTNAERIKRTIPFTSPNNNISNSTPLGIGKTFKYITINDERKGSIFTKLYGLTNSTAKAMDGELRMNGITRLQIKSTSEGLLGNSQIKTILTNNDLATERTSIVKGSQSNYTSSISEFTDQNIEDVLMANFLDGVRNPDNDLFQAYIRLKDEGKEINEIWEELYNLVNEQPELKAFVIDFIGGTSVMKRKSGYIETLEDDFLTGNKEHINIYELPTENFGSQLKAEQDYEKNEASNMSQIISITPLANIENSTVILNELANIASDGINSLVKQIEKNDWDTFFRKMNIESSSNNYGSFNQMVNNRNISMDLGSVYTKGMYNFFSRVNKFISPKMSGVRMTQASDAFINVYYDEATNKIYTKTEAMERGLTKTRKLNPMTYTDSKGNRINTQAELMRAVASGEKINVTAAEILIPYSYVSKFNIGNMTLSDAMSLTYLDSNDEVQVLEMHGMSQDEIIEAINSADIKNIVDDRGGLMTDMASIAKYYTAFEKSLNVFADRVPSHSFASGFVGKAVGFINDAGNVIITSPERTLFDGSDFDIDQLTVYFSDINKNLDIIDSPENRIFSNIEKMYKEPTSESLLLMLTELKLDDLKSLIESDKRDGKNIFSKYQSITATLANQKVVGDGKKMVGLFANLMKFYGNISYVVRNNQDPETAEKLRNLFGGFNTRLVLSDALYNEYFADKDAIELPKTLSKEQFSDLNTDLKELYYEMNDVNEEGEHILDIIGKFLNASTDNPKELILGFMNINKTSFNLVSSMILNGSTKQEIYDLITDEKIVNVITRLETSKSVNNFEANNLIYELKKMIEREQKNLVKKDIATIIEENKADLESLKYDLELGYRMVSVTKHEQLEDSNGNIYDREETIDQKEDIDREEIERDIENLIANISYLENLERKGITEYTESDEIVSLQYTLEHAFRGQYISNLNNIVKLNQGFEAGQYESDVTQIETLEWLLGKSLEDVFEQSPKRNWIDKYRYTNKDKFDDIEFMMSELKNENKYPDPELIAAQIPHLKQYILALRDVKMMKKNSIRYSDTITKLKDSLLSKLNRVSFAYKEEFYEFMNAIDSFIIGTYFDKHETMDINMVNSYTNKNHNLGTAQGRQDFSDDFPALIQRLLEDYQFMKSNNPNISNAFLDSINVTGTKTGGMSIILVDSAVLSEDRKAAIQNGFTLIDDIVNQISNGAVNLQTYKDLNLKELFRSYDVIRYGMAAQEGTLSDVIGKNAITEENTLLEKISSHIDVLKDSFNKLEIMKPAKIKKNMELRKLQTQLTNLEQSLLVNNKLLASVPKSKVLKSFNASLSKDKFFNNYDVEITKEAYINTYMPEYAKQFNSNRGVYETKIRKIDENGQVFYQGVFSKQTGTSKAYSEADQISEIPVLKTGLSKEEILKLQSGKRLSNISVANIGSLFDTGNQLESGLDNKIYIPRVGEVKITREYSSSKTMSIFKEKDKTIIKASKVDFFSNRIGEEVLNHLVNKLRALNPNLNILTHTSEEIKAMGPQYQDVLGWVENGVVHLNEDLVRADTLVHEISHLFIDDLEVSNPKLYEHLKALAVQELNNDSNDLAKSVIAKYPELNENDLAKEYMATVTGLGSMGKIEDIAKNDINKSIFRQIVEWIKSRIFGIEDTIKEYSEMDIMNMDLVEFSQVFSEQVLDYGYFNYNFNTSNNPSILIEDLVRSGQIRNVDSETLKPC